MAEKKERKGPLTHLRVIELGQLIAGPFCGQLLADFGADVIKVEPPGKGDPMRDWGRGDFPLWWTICARNKRCVTANLRQPEGQDLVKKLVAEADILLENFRPGTMERWGLGYDELSKINPGLIMVRVSGYGQSGPYSPRAGYALVGEAMGGMRHIAGYPDRPSCRAGISIGDSLAATYACLGALAAIEHRNKTGKGQMIDSAIYEAVLNVMESVIPDYSVSGYIRERSGSKLPSIAPSNVYECKDGSFVIGANQDTVFKRLCDAMEMPELVENERYSTHIARGQNQDELDEIVNAWTKTKTMDEIDDLMIENGVPAGRVYRAPEMLKDPHFAAREAIVDIEHPEIDNLKMQNVFPKFSETPTEIRWPGPKLGEHTLEVYKDVIGLSDDELDTLKEKEII